MSAIDGVDASCAAELEPAWPPFASRTPHRAHRGENCGRHAEGRHLPRGPDPRRPARLLRQADGDVLVRPHRQGVRRGRGRRAAPGGRPQGARRPGVAGGVGAPDVRQPARVVLVRPPGARVEGALPGPLGAGVPVRRARGASTARTSRGARRAGGPVDVREHGRRRAYVAYWDDAGTSKPRTRSGATPRPTAARPQRTVWHDGRRRGGGAATTRTGRCDNLVKIWRCTDEGEWEKEKELAGHSDWVRDVRARPRRACR